MKKRNLIRIISIITALFAVTLVFAIDGNIKAKKFETLVEYNYQKSLDDLGTYIDNISSALNKGIYYQSPTQISLLSAKLWREA
ncbi:MAG: germination protein YpeB, partial [Oscillospiraceae bacterium]|nr:germination protein YpeB [Oscillospiraceae bacterium]